MFPASSGPNSPIGLAFSCAIAIHLVLVFAVGFKISPPSVPASTIEVSLAQHRSETTPEDADYIAQFDQEGSGSLDKSREITTDHVSPLASPVFHDAATPVESQYVDASKPEPEQRFISTLGETRDEADRESTPNPSEQPQTPPNNAREISSLRAKLSHQRQLYAKIPRTLVLTTASARAADEAEYLRRWIEWVEKIGNENYPEEARRKKIYGAMRMAVTMERDGEVTGVEILQSSGQRVLDQAAVRIVRLAAPFEPFPSVISEDRIEIIRTWNFIPGNLFSTSAN
jgi:periplasmic protein TonB